MVEISNKAVAEFKKVLEVMGKPNFNIKFIKIGSSCCRLSYKILFVDKAKDDDLEIEKDGLKFLFDKEVYEKFENAIIDYNENFEINI